MQKIWIGVLLVVFVNAAEARPGIPRRLSCRGMMLVVALSALPLGGYKNAESIANWEARAPNIATAATYEDIRNLSYDERKNLFEADALLHLGFIFPLKLLDDFVTSHPRYAKLAAGIPLNDEKAFIAYYGATGATTRNNAFYQFIQRPWVHYDPVVRIRRARFRTLVATIYEDKFQELNRKLPPGEKIEFIDVQGAMRHHAD